MENYWDTGTVKCMLLLGVKIQNIGKLFLFFGSSIFNMEDKNKPTKCTN